MRIDKKRASTLFAMTLLIASLLLVNMNGPSSAASPSTPSGTAPASIQENEFVWLHGPSLEPIHMNSNKTLTPVHMHYTGGLLEQTPPEGTWWHELSPDYCDYWLLTVCEDNGDGLFGPNDQINMTEEVSGTWTMYHMDRITYTLNLSWPYPDPVERIFVELKAPPIWEPTMPPVCTLWHEVWSIYSNVYHCIGWTESQPNGRVDFCDTITLNNTKTGVITQWHVDDVATDIILREKIIDPTCTWWHAIYPEEEFCKWYHLTSWEDDPDILEGQGMLSPRDQIDMIEEVSKNKTWYFVDRLTVTLNVTDDEEFPTKWMKIELKSDFEEIYEVFKLPVGTLWHEVIPEYSNVYNLTIWDLLKDDNCNGVLDPCDWIWLQNITNGEPLGDPVPWHIADMTYDLILNKKIADPVCTDWHAIYPPDEFCNWYHVDDWEDTQPEGDPGYGLLSPCDNVIMNDGGIYHVENMTVTLLLSNLTDPLDIMYVEAWPIPFEYMYWPKIYPAGEFYWHEVWPNFCTLYYTMNWTDNCNGVLDYCDKLSLRTVVGLVDSYWHVEEVAVDMVVQKVGVLVHDVAVVEVFSEYAWVYQGEIDPIHVTVTNLGDYDEPTVTVYAFYDGNLAAPPKTTSLNIGQTKVLTFDWNTSGVPPGFYTVSANATIPVDDVPGNNYLQGNDQEVRERLPPPPLPVTADLELHPRMVYDIDDPTGTQWHELHPSRTNFYQVLEWYPSTVLSPEDIVYMYGTDFVVDDVTIDIEVLDEQTGTLYWLDYECGYWTFDPENPICTKWNEIKNNVTHMPPYPPRCWHLTDWFDNGDGRLSYCDGIVMTPNDPYPGLEVLFHVELVTVTLKLTEWPTPITPVQYYLEFMGTLEEFQTNDYIHSPYYTAWYELWPVQGRDWELVEWIDQSFLSPSDQILLTLKDEFGQPIPGAEAEYHVDKLTVAMNLTSMDSGMEHIVKFEGSLRQFKQYYWVEPYGTQWHEVSPTYCRQWYLYYWDDTSMEPGILDHCDHILMIDKEGGYEEWFHVESLSTDMWVTQKICGVDITNVTLSRCGTLVDSGYTTWTIQVNVTVHNNGTIPIDCTVNAYCYNATTTILIGSFGASLDPCNTITLTFNWNLSDLRVCNSYTVKANATCACGASDEFVDGLMKVKMIGDVDGTNYVDWFDMSMVGLAYESGPGAPSWNRNCDFDGSKYVDWFDLSMCGLYYESGC